MTNIHYTAAEKTVEGWKENSEKIVEFWAKRVLTQEELRVVAASSGELDEEAFRKGIIVLAENGRKVTLANLAELYF